MTEIDQQLAELQAENEELGKRAQVRELELINQAHKGVLQEQGWGSLVDRTEFLKDTPNFFAGAHFRLSVPHNKKDGDYYPHFRTEQDLQRIRGESQYISASNPVAIGILDDLANYTVSTGYTYKADHKENSMVSDQVLLEVQEVVDDFNERMDAEFGECSFEREIFKRTRESGEVFAHLEHVGDGYCDLNIAEAEWITEPRNHANIAQQMNMPTGVDWKYGIASTPKRPSQRHGFFVMWNGEAEAARYHTTEEIFHLKVNVPRNVKRGLPDFYGVVSYLEDHAGLLRGTVRGAKIQSSIALIREHQAGFRGGDVDRLISSNTQAKVNLPALGPGGSVRQKKVRAYEEGTVLDVVASKYYPGPLGAANGPTYVEIGQAVVRIVGARWSMPEHMISNAISGGGGARAAIVEMGTPFARATIVRQNLYKKYFSRLMWQAIKWAALHGRISEHFLTLKQSIDLKVTPPDATQRNEAEQHLVFAGRNQLGVMSKQTISEKVGLDYETEQERIQIEREQDLQFQMAASGMQMQQQMDAQAAMGANNPNETVQKQAAGKPGQGEVGKQNFQGSGSDSTIQNRGLGTRNAVQSMKQKLAAGRAGKQVSGFGS